MSTVAVIQARMGSSRLPGKTLMPLGDETVVDWVVTRVGLAQGIDEVIVATTTNPEDDQLVEHLADKACTVVRGDPHDVLDRFRVAVEPTSCDRLVRITADCPLLDPGLIELGLLLHERTQVDYVATGLDGRMPHGIDLEVVSRSALEIAAEEAVDPVEREHVTPFIVRRPDRFPQSPLVAPSWLRYPELRFTLDEEADFRLISQVVTRCGRSARMLETRDVVTLLRQEHDLAALNGAVSHRNVD